MDSARALFEFLEFFEKASGLTLNVTKTEAMWIGSLQNCENEPLGVKCKTCVKFLGIYITYDVQIFSTFAPYDQGGLKMLDYDNMIKALRLSWLKQIVNPDFFGFWSYLDQLFVNEGGLFLIQCNYDINRLTISATFYRELLDW